MKIGFVGAGKMGEAYISALCGENEVFIYEVDNSRKNYISEKYNVAAVDQLSDLLHKTDFIVLAVKPQFIKVVTEEIKEILREAIDEKVFISIAAGVKIGSFEKWFDCNSVKLVRVMPNTPCLIKKGISGYTPNKNIITNELENIKYILRATGDIIETKEENLDIVTAISGSGPAYVLVLLNSIADAGVKLGLSKELSLKLATETFIGTAELLKTTGEHPEKLKDNVTSPGGTTAAGLYEMEKNGIRKALIETVEAAFLRSVELGKGE